MSDIDSALAADPDSVLAHLAFVRVCWDMGWHEPALAAGRLVFSRHPDSLKAALAFARALNNVGLAQFALPLADSTLTADPTNPAALRLRIWCHLMVGNFGHAVGAAADYLPAHPGDANTRWAAALAYRPPGNPTAPDDQPRDHRPVGVRAHGLGGMLQRARPDGPGPPRGARHGRLHHARGTPGHRRPRRLRRPRDPRFGCRLASAAFSKGTDRERFHHTRQARRIRSRRTDELCGSHPVHRAHARPRNPFGLFAGAAPARIGGPADVTWHPDHGHNLLFRACFVL
jgi:hypothetical protein